MAALSFKSCPNESLDDIVPLGIEEAASRIQAMRLQECAYGCTDYLHQQQHEDSAPVTAPQEELNQRVDGECRRKMSEWCYQVVDHCDFNRETVCIAMSHLDRFLATESGMDAINDRKKFQLVAMTCLFTSIKLNEPVLMQADTLSELSRGIYSEEDFVHMEMEILTALQWRVQPPTPQSFTDHFLALFPFDGVSETVSRTIRELSRYQIELAVNDPSLIAVRPSIIATASLLNIIEGMSNVCLPESTVRSFLRNFSRLTSIDHLSFDVSVVQSELLHNLTNCGGLDDFEKNAQFSPVRMQASKKIQRSWQSSPKCVSQKSVCMPCAQ